MPCQLEGSQTRKAKLKQNICKKTGSLLPFIKWIMTYSKIDAIADFIAGVTIGMILIPQGVAYVAIVGLSAKIGLLSTVIGSIIYTFIGTIKEISIGPTAMMSLLTNEYIKAVNIDSIGLLCFGCGVVGLLLSILRLGLIVEFISVPVSSAFGTAVAFTILASELKNFFGLHYKSNLFSENLHQFFLHAHLISFSDMSLGILTTVMLILLGKLTNVPVPKSWKHQVAVKQTLWFIAMSRNAITLFLACLLTKYFEKCHSTVPYVLTEPVTPGLPEVQLPWKETKNGNVTLTAIEKTKLIYPGMIVIPIVALLVHITIAKFFDSAHTVSVTHELIANSLGNLLSAFFNSSPIAGAFSRSAVSSVIEVRTPLSNFYAGVMCFLALTYLTPYFRLIPKASLSAVIVTAIMAVVDYQIVLPLWKNSKKDLFTLVVTLAVALIYGVEHGLIVGVICNILFLVYLWARPSILIERCKSEHGDYAKVTPDLGLFFPAVGYLESEMSKTLKKDHFRNLPIAVNCLFFKGLDYTAVKGLTRIIKLYQKQKRTIVFFNANQKLSDMCCDMDNSVSLHFCNNEENLKNMLFGVEVELNDVKVHRIVKPKINEVNGDHINELAKKPPQEEVPLLNIIKTHDRPNSL